MEEWFDSSEAADILMKKEWEYWGPAPAGGKGGQERASQAEGENGGHFSKSVSSLHKRA